MLLRPLFILSKSHRFIINHFHRMADQFTQDLKNIHQHHIVQKYLIATEQERIAFRKQIEKLNTSYPGGLKSYIERGRKLLKDSKEGVNPYEGLTPSVPKGVELDYNDEKAILHYETIGEQEMQRTGFVLVAGGLGERLGYKGIKISIPMDIVTETTFLEYYISFILAVQQKLGNGNKLPLAIMTSDDTHALTLELLEHNKYFGMNPQQLTIIKQEKVPSLLDAEGRMALEAGKLVIETKPHGHGDVHTLLYSEKITQIWQEKYNTKWIVFFQDTNPLMFKSIIATIGVSKELDLEMNTVGVKIKAGEAVGAITKLVDENGKELVINVQYNQLGSMLKSFQGETITKDGHLVLPGNTNGLIFDLTRYHKVLQKTQGNITQFINPKYTDNTLTAFKSPTRLQCMMQDYPKLLDNCNNVGFTMIDRRFCFAACKNDPKTAADKSKQGLPTDSASSCQASVYESNRELLRYCGAEIETSEAVEFNGIKADLFPRIILAPKFAVSLKELKSKVKKLKVSAGSTLAVLSDCVLEDVEVDGTLRIKGEGNIVVKETSKNYEGLVPTEGHEEAWQIIRGYKASL